MTEISDHSRASRSPWPIPGLIPRFGFPMSSTGPTRPGSRRTGSVCKRRRRRYDRHCRQDAGELHRRIRRSVRRLCVRLLSPTLRTVKRGTVHACRVYRGHRPLRSLQIECATLTQELSYIETTSCTLYSTCEHRQIVMGTREPPHSTYSLCFLCHSSSDSFG